MLPKPTHLGPEYAAQFADPSVAAAYRHRPPYPAATFDILAELVVDEPRNVLDVGCGRGEIARPLVTRVDRVEAVDPSAAMIAHGRGLPGGDHPALTWIQATAEEAPLRPPYALITAGASLHWMAWDVVMPRFANSLTPRGVLAIVDVTVLPSPWDDDLRPIIDAFSTNRDYRPYNLVDELTLRGLFRLDGQRRTDPVAFVQSIDDYVESFHARDGFSRDRMEPAHAAAFDDEVRHLVGRQRPSGEVELGVVGVVVWGQPLGS